MSISARLRTSMERHQGMDRRTRLSRFIDSLPEETCKDSLQVQESCKENQDSFTSLEEAAYEYSFESRPSIYGQVDVIDAFIAGAEWQKEHSFKPTQEHLDALDTVYKTHSADNACRHILLNLLNQLKEL